ncbi:hypothetical protein COT99_02940 [Candidatus Falkowbacteria bacterium CG10_big_fil_rev_8_21_14_0_10_43_10]|uniref:Uncharacterized protein n=1 Tax=Candidatus Falkowbacteria bacterium CG10_big_fil_rev_8_21_14_0_10_43_10 TaxID=1974567 RepID=A0A2H0V1X2_9BACT|nr:MAG: hypothetical protein COT99_02940 [Candidatus Falkowbacteria bacterium CG10_big_fil_rev_8_21_14_0_10_43_10]
MYAKKNKTEESEKGFGELLKEREKDNNIDQELKEIYEDESPLVPISKNGQNKDNINVRRREINPWVKIAWTFLALLLVLAGISWVSFFILQQGGRLDSKDIEFKIIGPEEVVAGQEVIYEIQYKNLSEFNLKNVEIYLTYPNNFAFVDAVPPPARDSSIWEFEQVDTKRSARIEIKGKIIGPALSQAELAAAIAYRPENFSSTFSAEDDFITKIVSTGISSGVEASSFFNVNEESEIILTYARQKENFIDSFRARLEHGENFVVAAGAESSWEIKEVTDAQQKLAIKGTYVSQPKNEEKIKLILEAPQAAAAGIKYYPFYEYEFSPIVAEGALNLSLSVNGSAADKPVNFGDTLNYVAHYKNASEASLKNVIIMAVVNSKIVDWRALVDGNKGEVKGDTIMWTKEELGELAEISPGEENSFGFSLKIKPRDQIKDVPANDLRVVASLDYSVNSAIKSDGTPIAQITSRVNSDLNFTSELRYFDRNNVSIGEGPLPPKVGEKTTYRAYWTLTNSLHDLENIEITTELPENIKWENNYNENMGSVGYDAGQRKITWKINSWDAVSQPAMFDFSISVTPAESDRNKILTVLNQPRVEAKDKETNGVIVLTGKAKTTNLEDDGVGKGQGKVEYE